MGNHASVRAVLAGAALVALAGCSGAGSGTSPDVPGETTAHAGAGATSLATTAAPVTGTGSNTGRSNQPSGRQSATSVTSTSQGRQDPDAGPFARANSIPFPVAVGNTWVYRTSLGNQTGQTTNRIVAAAPGATGYDVTMSSTTVIAGTAATVQPVYVFYPNGTIGYPVPMIDGISVLGTGVRWPAPAGLASGRPYHSTLRILVSQTGEYENADVTVQGAGTTHVTVPAGTYLASVVDTTVAAQAGTIEITTWIAQGVGPVETTVTVEVAGKTVLSTTDELLSFTKGQAGIGS